MSTAKMPKANAQASLENWPGGSLFAPFGAWPLFAPFSAWNGFAAQNARFTLSGLDAVQNALKTWRQVIDASTSALRRQQDLALETACLQLSRAAPASSEDAPSSEAASMFAPMMAAAKAYEQVGDAVLHAQRGAFEATSSKAHP